MQESSLPTPAVAALLLHPEGLAARRQVRAAQNYSRASRWHQHHRGCRRAPFQPLCAPSSWLEDAAGSCIPTGSAQLLPAHGGHVQLFLSGAREGGLTALPCSQSEGLEVFRAPALVSWQVVWCSGGSGVYIRPAIYRSP